MRTSDEELMARCRNGDMSAFELLVIRYKDLIVNYIHRCICDYHRAEDLAQETFIRVLKSANSYEPKCQFKNWIYLIATNLCRNEVRNRNRRNTAFLDDLVPEGEDVNHSYFMRDRGYLPDELYEKKEQQLMIQGALNMLPENQRIALNLVTFQDLRYDEIGEIMNCSVSAVKSLIHRARQNLKSLLIEVGIGESFNAKV
ncbi:MAG: sigma-70 family RNA polymerase sigma factor [Candidatus Poribacteria bacterium]|nr:sigma-70 family RNA polymerase sigma factor [Candidatus Poribacteria bacterium]MDE0503173.1 sigma-70 family RNA polymerase sigma factor [Candidatus Poribacteria bacterium]